MYKNVFKTHIINMIFYGNMKRERVEKDAVTGNLILHTQFAITLHYIHKQKHGV